MDEIISLSVVKITRSGVIENPDLAKDIFQAHNIDYKEDAIMSVLSDKRDIKMKVVDQDQADFIILAIDATLFIDFELTIGCFYSQIDIMYNEKYLFKIYEFLNKFEKYSREVRFVVTNMDKLEFPQEENFIKDLIIENSNSYAIYPGDIHFDNEHEYKRLLADMCQRI